MDKSPLSLIGVGFGGRLSILIVLILLSGTLGSDHPRGLTICDRVAPTPSTTKGDSHIQHHEERQRTFQETSVIPIERVVLMIFLQLAMWGL